MNKRNRFTATLLAGLSLGVFATLAKADALTRKTILTVREPVSISDVTLQPGTYVIRIVDSMSNKNIVRIYNEEENRVIATILAGPAERLFPAGKTDMRLYEVPAGQTPAVREWYWPDDNFGQRFLYSPQRQLLAQAAPPPAAEPTPAPEPQPAPEPEAAPPPPPPAPEPEPPAPPPVEEPAPMLPKTASLFPLIALAGLFSLGAALSLRFTTRS